MSARCCKRCYRCPSMGAALKLFCRPASRDGARPCKRNIHDAQICSAGRRLLRQQGKICPALRSAARRHGRCASSTPSDVRAVTNLRQPCLCCRKIEEAIYERNVEHAFGTDFRSLFVILADDDRPQSGRVSRGAEVPIRVAPLALWLEKIRMRISALQISPSGKPQGRICVATM